MSDPRHASDDLDKKPLIELTPPTPKEDLPVGGKFEERWVSAEHPEEPEGERIPVPAVPLHLCPTCDYNLTGLTARRCPECGEPFTLPEARDRAVEKSFGIWRYFATEFHEKWKLRIGWTLLVVGIFLPLTRRGWPFWPQFRRGGAISLVALPILLAMTYFYKVIRDTTWADAIFVFGIASALLGAAVAFL